MLLIKQLLKTNSEAWPMESMLCTRNQFAGELSSQSSRRTSLYIGRQDHYYLDHCIYLYLDFPTDGKYLKHSM